MKNPSLCLFPRLRGRVIPFFLFLDKRLCFPLEFVEFLGRGSSRRRNRLTTAHLPFHEFGERTIGTRTKLLIASLLGNSAIIAKNDDGVGALDSGEAVGNADSGVVTTKKSS